MKFQPQQYFRFICLGINRTLQYSPSIVQLNRPEQNDNINHQTYNNININPRYKPPNIQHKYI